jgi:poly(hydroxyalkanoate) depolymerase family esterase
LRTYGFLRLVARCAGYRVSQVYRSRLTGDAPRLLCAHCGRGRAAVYAAQAGLGRNRTERRDEAHQLSRECAAAAYLHLHGGSMLSQAIATTVLAPILCSAAFSAAAFTQPGVAAMRSLSDTLIRLKRLSSVAGASTPANSRLQPFTDFGSNPGRLKAWIHVPDTAASSAPLVVVLHGCTQSASGYDESSGWSRLADQFGFIVLYPEQQRGNNPNLCFNWFSPADAARGHGEALSIRQMITAVQTRHRINADRIFVNGLSAGGAMAAVMLATYPDVFAAGAVIAGLPFGIAETIPEAFDRMRGTGGPAAEELTELVKNASAHTGPWPRVSVWHGSRDNTVDQLNASALVEQWRPIHGVPAAPSEADTVNGYPHRVWRDASGRAVIEEYRVTGLGHGAPLDVVGSDHGETAAPFMLDASISSTRLIASFWGIAPEQAKLGTRRAVETSPTTFERSPPGAEAVLLPQHAGIKRTIEDALRSAGLMK